MKSRVFRGVWLLSASIAAFSCQSEKKEVGNPAATGACCEQTCAITTAADCQGVYQGDGSLCTPDPCGPSESHYTASGQVSSNASGAIRTDTGAAIQIPRYAVPFTAADSTGRMVFSIERDQSVSPPVPGGGTRATDTYRFGPEGFVFARPVKVTLPLSGSLAGKDYRMYRVNPTTGEAEAYGGAVDTVAKTISANTYRFSPWFAASYDPASTAYGAFKITNGSATYWLNLCVVSYVLTYPSVDANFPGEVTSGWAPVGDIGWNNTGNWYLPQGRYRLCAEMRTIGTVLSPPGPPKHTYLDDLVLDRPWSYTHPDVHELLPFTGPGTGWLDGPCDCTPTATPSVGTGQVQVTLTWHSAASIDLDLWVTEPGGERCFYGNTPTTTGGALDIDNKCFDYLDGRPENIFWANAPAGEYKVEVNWYSDCLNGMASMPFEVRVVNGTATRTYSMTLTPDPETLEVCRFTVGSHRPASGGLAQGTSEEGLSEPLGTPGPPGNGPRK